MTRYRLVLEYDGGGFVGWQRQDNGPSIQQALEEAVEAFCGERVDAVAAGRTDAGVHALGQVVHLDLERPWEPDVLRDAVNHHLRPAPISVLEAAEAPDDFHARFAAIGRVYRYRIVSRRSPLTLERGQAWWVPSPLAAEPMEDAARLLVGEHDFTSFRASECQAKSPVRTLDALEVRRLGEEICITARARSFLHHQVRNMVGTLVLVGKGKWRSADVGAALEARDRAAAGPTAPAEGLYLVTVSYPEQAL